MDTTVQDDPATITNEHLEAELTSWSARLAAAMASWLAALAEYDRRRGWEGWGCRSCAQWLSWQCGLGPRSAREHLRVAHALGTLPRVAAAMATGELSFSRARAITRVAVPATEQLWLDLARASTAAQLERAVRGVRRAERAGDPRLAQAQRSVRWHWDDDGTLVLRADLPADAGRLVVAALEAAVGRVPSAEPGADDPREARRADALVLLASGTAAPEVALVLHTTPTDLAQPDDAPAAPAIPDGATPADLDRVVVGGLLRGGPAVATEVARRLACDATVRAVDAGGHLGKPTRLVRGKLRRRLLRRDGACRWPGCASRAHLHAHHVRHWAQGGPTTLANLVLLCGSHHRLVHDGRWSLHFDGQHVEVRRPDGRTVPTTAGSPDRRPPDALDDAARPVMAEWDGWPLHLADVVEGVLHVAERADAAPAAAGGASATAGGGPAEPPPAGVAA
jgi:hypothetical protein